MGGLRHGQGTFKTKGGFGTIYVGEFCNDIRHGPGIMTRKNKNKVTGTWENDRLNGRGTIQIDDNEP